MKTPQEWVDEIWPAAHVPRQSCVHQLRLNAVRTIQQDAVQSCLKLCASQMEPRCPEEYDETNGHANRGIGNCMDALEVLLKSVS